MKNTAIKGDEIMANLFIQETFINKTENISYGESEVYETFTSNILELFKFMKKEYGRCVGKVYIDENDFSIVVGWIFEKKMKYSDVDDHYVQQTRVTVHTGPPTKTIEYNYAKL